VPKVWSFLAVSAVLAALFMPLLLLLQAKSAVALWLLMPLCIGLSGVHAGLMTVIGPQIYTPAIRASGFNTGGGCEMSHHPSRGDRVQGSLLVKCC
jgi:hypothetical protein